MTNIAISRDSAAPLSALSDTTQTRGQLCERARSGEISGRDSREREIVFRLRRNYLALGSLLAAMVVVGSGSAQAGLINAKTCSLVDVTAAITAAVDGDTVVVPAGTADWTSTLTITKGITLQGQTTTNTSTTNGTFNDQTIIQDDTLRPNGRIIVINCSLGQTVRLTGFTFQAGTTTAAGQSGSLALLGTCHALRVDHCHFDRLHQGQYITVYNWVYGVIDHNIFDHSTGEALWVSTGGYGSDTPGMGDKSWASPPNFGSSDFLFFEDNCVNNHTNVETVGATDGQGGARYVQRYNHFTNAFAGGGHGTETVSRGVRAIERYNNDFHWTISSNGGSLRTGVLVSHDNTWYGNAAGASAGKLLICYRSFFSYSPWGGASGANAWDLNDTEGNGTNVPGHSPFLYDSGTHTGATGSSTLIDSTKNWTTNQWKDYTAVNPATGAIYLISSNTNNTITYFVYSDSGGTPKWANGSAYQIRKVLAVLDQPGRGQGDLIIRSGGNNQLPLNSTAGTIAWPNQALEPCYSWNDKYSPTNALVGFQAGTGPAIILANREFYNNTPMPGYTPYVYPHPLVTGGASPSPTPAQTPSAPKNLRITGP